MDAARFNSVECCDILVRHNANVFKQDGIGRNALHVAAQAGSTEVVRYILETMKSVKREQTERRSSPDIGDVGGSRCHREISSFCWSKHGRQRP
ncbi:hypothetical protein BIW11_04571 [Tropilaelaps mercedesae]|uniref:Uncharacterized protein n=1 Tax=Tropilaelaps mercedesae TaxID=418985 RepID=A0A1V9X4H9_9ACAR|nr:hypothetical protein BIW11_04571 [Tropilaelaps mercedesae]